MYDNGDGMTNRELFALINRVYLFDSIPSNREMDNVAVLLGRIYERQRFITRDDLDEVVEVCIFNKRRSGLYCLDMSITISIIDKIIEELKRRSV